MNDTLHDDLNRFYSLLVRLTDKPGQGRPLPEVLSSRSLLPTKGVYFFVEPGEVRKSHPKDLRVVRIGTHGVSAGAKSSLRMRLKQHLGTNSGGGNYQSSVFRQHIGAALLARDSTKLNSWGAISSATSDVTLAEAAEVAELEKRVSVYISQMSVFWIAVLDEASPRSDRASIERNVIALLSNHGAPTDIASPQWLGNYSPQPSIRQSALWNMKHVGDSYDPAFLNKLELYVGLTAAENGGLSVEEIDRDPPSLKHVKQSVRELSDHELGTFARWFERFRADA